MFNTHLPIVSFRAGKVWQHDQGKQPRLESWLAEDHTLFLTGVLQGGSWSVRGVRCDEIGHL